MLAVILVTFGLTWWKLREVPLLVIGQPTTTGAMQQDREAPFFEGRGIVDRPGGVGGEEENVGQVFSQRESRQYATLPVTQRVNKAKSHE